MGLEKVLHEKFGFDQFRSGQREIIEDVIQRQNVLAILPTGGGKSLCYQLPAYFLEGSVLVISPLVSLMEDQVTLIKQRGEKSVIALNSFLSYEERLAKVQRLHEYKFIFISPEMLLQPYMMKRLESIQIAYTVIDEAHCISQWGFDFRPEYLRIHEFLQRLPIRQVLALTATADEKVVQDITSYLHLTNAQVHKRSLDRSNISYWIMEQQTEEQKELYLLQHVTTTVGPGIVYVSSRKRADELASLFQGNGLHCAAYHAGMEQVDRAFIQQQFIQGEIDWVFATTAFGMGIHKDDVRQVIHEHIPSTIANYVQEVGRAGRDGQPSIALLLYSEEDKRKGHFLIDWTIPEEEAVRYYYQLLHHEPRHIAAQLANLSETEQRVVDYYMARLSEGEVIQQLSIQRNEKTAAFQRMLDYLTNDTCYRNYVLKVFGEQQQRTYTICCSNCTEELPKWLFDLDIQKEEKEIVDWEERLNKLLL